MKNFLTSDDFKRQRSRSASVDPTLAPDAFRAAVFEAVKLGLAEVRVKSRGRRYTFYWFRKGKRIAVKVGAPPPCRPAVEVLAKELLKEQRAAWTCALCGKAFQRVGKQKYCSPAHAAKMRKLRWSGKREAEASQAREVAEVERRKAESAQLMARNEQLRRKRKPTLRPRGARLTADEASVWHQPRPAAQW